MSSDKKNLRPVFSRRYELTGNPLSRQLRLWFRMKTSIIGNFDTGPGLKNLLTLWLLHRIGKPVFYFRTWLQNRRGLKNTLRPFIPGRGKSQDKR